MTEDKAQGSVFSTFSGIENAIKILISKDAIDYSTSLVRHSKQKDFLLMDCEASYPSENTKNCQPISGKDRKAYGASFIETNSLLKFW